ncbi:putative CocE/NonD family hydrolase [Streptomyces griseochromogenes]|uniref:CocE/NonD family hydrolase n=1 Tax=Streptomyces griseochromogenes TaxID=68214 RepID=A0A1B1AVH7_9ACTN|nr:CocE/NonD family hydrolase [Streptomyces griseochromogenes]ANP50584.1 peptidase S15 [Streptomyces griseochromogenes]MBP2051353.1 putative CocE/NonD family hydrolase [Streptomyces griseochromogenes]
MFRRVPGSRAALALALGAALTVPLAPTARAAATDRYTVTALKFTVQAGGRSCAVDADLYRPAGVDGSHPAPAVLVTNGFGGSKSDAETGAVGKVLAQRGYVALLYSGLGFGGSGCLISLDDPDIDGRAASRLIDFLGGRTTADDGTRADFVTLDSAGDPRVGMIGGSYGGAIQLATASVDHRVDALVPMLTWHDLAYSLDPNNATGTVPGAFKWQWTNGFYLSGESQPLTVPNLDPSRINSLTCLHFATRACAMVHRLDSGSYPAAETAESLAYAHSVSPVSYLDRVKAPTLLVQGQADSLFNLNEATATYETLKAQGTTTKMIWQSWGHSGGKTDPAAGELDIARGNLETSYVGRRILAWFDRYLRGHEGVDTGPAFAYYRDWITDPDSTYATADRLPALTETLYLSGDGKLVDNRKKVALGSRTYRNWPVSTSHSENSVTGILGVPDPAPYDTRGTYAAWTSEPLTRTTDVVGAPRATLEVVSPVAERTQDSGDAADKLVLFVKLYDIAPDGTSTLVHRLVAPVRVPDVTRSFTVTLPGIVHRYPKGHRLRFVIAASDDAYFGNRGIKPVTVVSAPGDTGVLELPVSGG